MDFKTIDISNFNQMKPLIKIYYDFYQHRTNLKEIKEIMKETNLHNFLYEFVHLIIDTNNMPLVELKEDAYQVYRHFYQGLNNDFKILTPKEIENAGKIDFSTNKFHYLDNMLLHFGNFNKLFKDISNLNTSQYQDLNIIKDLVEQSQKLLKISQLESFKSQLNQISLLKPYITNQISLIQKDINHHLVKVNEICNNKPTLKDLYKSYSNDCSLMLNNFDKLKENINPQIISNNRNLRNIKNLGDR